MSKIEWTEKTWNPVSGCSKVSVGCANCYAERMAKRLKAMGQPRYKNGFRVTLHPEALDEPYRWKKPRIVFVNSMSDLFHEKIPVDFIQNVFTVMNENPRHTFQVLTKRPENALRYCYHWLEAGENPPHKLPDNVWFGVTAENQKCWDERKEAFFAIPAAVHFVSNEPLLGELQYMNDELRQLDWIIVGGESGPGARPMHPDWARDIRDQCQAAGVPLFFKQWGKYFPRCQWEDNPDLILPDDGDYEHDGKTIILEDHTPMHPVGKKKAGCLLDGQEYREYPNS